MKKIFYLKTCDTCRKILRSLPNTEGFTLREIKTEPITTEELEEMRRLAGSYEALFSRKATLYKERGLKDKQLSEEDYKNYINEHYTFLSRPVIVDGDTIFIGNGKKNVEAAMAHLS
ncbi:ArsC/Spx/MgsR family protein [uncultured Flavobacterium sp.]|uniref:arsenate reductase family protein n=1 Tax=uncultured Flavobacterium sp. TaxID=165435 RepID=UPI0025DA4760|nr:ArsC/Spx/MgsR family protein [uncultured Flavobacterium sp.]